MATRKKQPGGKAARQRPLRLWPGVVAVALLWLFRFGLPTVMPGMVEIGVVGGMLGGLAVLVWWLFFSRAPWLERLGALALMIIGMVVTPQFLHESVATGMMGMMFVVYAVPVLSLAFVAWAVVSRYLPAGLRWATMAATIVLACGAWTLVRTGGFTGELDHDFAWRWSETPEERLLARGEDAPAALPSETAIMEAETGWPGFRGPRRDGIVRGVRIGTDWSATPPVELWRRPVGPGWSSFAVLGDYFYTQEQRGEDELVSCYRVMTGEPVWKHRDAARFWESNGGAGPRGTPTLSKGCVYTFGATGILNALDAADGSIIWSRNAASDTDTKIPGWGFAGSPLVVDDLVVVAAAGALAAYDRPTGEPRWFGPAGKGGYSSPHLLTIDGVAQILLMRGPGATSVAPADGRLLWEHPLPPGTRIVQPARSTDGHILISDGDKNGMRSIAVSRGSGGWTSEEQWTSIGLKPYFNDFVAHHGYAYGFDGSILACIDLRDGKRRWKGGRFGYGQLLLLADQEVLLVLSEKGELALVAATPDQFSEPARFPALTGKTWNHPVLSGDILLVRNSREMAAFRLPPAGD